MNAPPEGRANLAWDDLPALFPGFPDPGRWLPLLQQHAGIVASAPAIRVTSDDARGAIGRHYAESLELLRLLLERGPFSSLVDVGSGGGFPGIVIALLCPDSSVHLVEPLKKRGMLLERMKTELGLANVMVLPLRAEEAGRSELRDAADVVTARAVAPLRELLEYTAPLAAPGGILALAKGSGLDAEQGAAEPAAAALWVAPAGEAAMRPEVSPHIRVAFYTKLRPTPARYPRRPGMPSKRPL